MSLRAGSWWVWSVGVVFLAVAGCGGGDPPRDAGHDAPDASAEVGPDTGLDATLDSGDAGNVGNDAASDATSDAPVDAPSDASDATSDATDAPLVTDAPSEEGPPPPPPMLTVDALLNSIVLDRCTGLMPATLMDVPAGQHSITLTASTLSKGSVSDPNDLPVPSYDDYVIVHLPLAAGQAASRRFFMLNSIGATASFTLSAAGTVKLMFIDSDVTYNEGQATVRLDTAGPTATVSGMANSLAWNMACSATPATLSVSDRPHRATLTESTLSAGGGGGSADDFVLLRLPTERPMDPHRFVILNGIGTSVDFTPYLGQSLRAWFMTSAPGATGRATIVVTDL